MNNQTYTYPDPATPGTTQHGYLGDNPPQPQGNYTETPSQHAHASHAQHDPHGTATSAQTMPHTPLHPGAPPAYSLMPTAYDWFLDYPGPGFSPHRSPAQPPSYHTHTPPSPTNQTPTPHRVYNVPLNRYQESPAPALCVVPRPEEDYQAMLQSMNDGNFSVPVFGAAGWGFPHNTVGVSAVQGGSGAGDAGMKVGQGLAGGAQTPGRRSRKRGGSVSNMF